LADRLESPMMRGMGGITIVALGDSTTAGTPGFKSPLESPPKGAGNIESQYAHWLMHVHADWEVLNRGINGERSDQIRARFDRDVLGAKPAAVVIIAGVNDIYQGRAADAVQRELEAMYVAAHNARIQVVAGTIIPFDTATPDQNARMHAINDWIRQRATNDAVLRFVDTRAAAADPANTDRLAGSPDGLHPDIDGYRRMAEALAPVLTDIL